MANAPADPVAEKPKLPRRCAKCATPKPDSHYKGEKGNFSPYCTSCRTRFPSLSAARVLSVKTTPRKR